MAKPERVRSPGLLQPLHVPDEAWQIITMDFIKGLPQSGNANYIMVIMDKFTKFAHFLALKHPYTTASVAKMFLDNVYKIHGMPASIVSDRDRVFTNKFWKELFCLAKVQLRMSTAYHPQSDGQSERVNQCLETFLRCFATACSKQWVSWLPLAEHWYNSSFHSAIGRSPFEALFSRSPRIFGLCHTQFSKAKLNAYLYVC
jgi:transposase InsO family protein